MNTSIKSDLNSASPTVTQPAKPASVAEAVAEVLLPAVVLLEALAQATPPTATKAQAQSLTTGTQTQAADTGTMNSLLGTGSLATALGTAVGNWISDLGDGQSTDSDSSANYGSVNEVGSDDSATAPPPGALPEAQPAALQKAPPKILQAAPAAMPQDLNLAALSPMAAKMSQRGLQNGTDGSTYTAAVDEETGSKSSHAGYTDLTARNTADISGSQLAQQVFHFPEDDGSAS